MRIKGMGVAVGLTFGLAAGLAIAVATSAQADVKLAVGGPITSESTIQPKPTMPTEPYLGLNAILRCSAKVSSAPRCHRERCRASTDTDCWSNLECHS